jgi:hypothetical protein
MKTLQAILTVALVAVMVTTGSAKKYTSAVVNNNDDLKMFVAQTLKSDMQTFGNYMYQNNISTLDGEATVTFFIDQSGTLIVTKVNCCNCDTQKYVTELFNRTKLNIQPDMTNKFYRVKLQLTYKAS